MKIELSKNNQPQNPEIIAKMSTRTNSNPKKNNYNYTVATFRKGVRAIQMVGRASTYNTDIVYHLLNYHYYCRCHQ